MTVECLCKSHLWDYAWKKLAESKQERYQSSKIPADTVNSIKVFLSSNKRGRFKPYLEKK